jgi:ABC-2 type transport system permease protein
MSTFLATSVTAEARKLRATRSTTVAVLAVLALTAGLAVANVLIAGQQDNPPLGAHALEHALRAPGQVLGFVMLLIGVLTAAGEYRHGTILSTLLSQPRRSRVVAAKVAAVGGLGVVASVATSVLAVAVSVPLLRSHGAPAQQLAGVPWAVLAVAGTAVGYGVIGVALGLLLRNQTAALGTALVWQFVVEGVLPVIFRSPGMVRFLPGGAAHSLGQLGAQVGSSYLQPWQGAAVFAGYALGLVAVATALAVPRDNA